MDSATIISLRECSLEGDSHKQKIECSDCLKMAVPKMVSALTLWNAEEISQLRTVSIDDIKCKEPQTILSNPMSSQGKAQDPSSSHQPQEVTDLRNSISRCQDISWMA